MKNLTIRTFIIVAVLLMWRTTQAEELTWHGFAAQGVIQSADSNFVNDDGDIALNLSEFGINTSYRINSKLRLSAQGVYLNGGNRYDEGARIDYLFLDYQLLNTSNWQWNVHLGRYKNYHWLYSATRDVPHTMPTNVLPQSTYFDVFRDISLGSDGISMAAQNLNGLGEWDFRWSYGKSQISQRQTINFLSDLATGRFTHDHDSQVSVTFRPLASNVSLGLSVLDTDFSYGSGDNDYFIDGTANLQRIMISLSYSSEHWDLNSEILRERAIYRDLVQQGMSKTETSEGGYAQARYFVTPDITLLARVDLFDLNRDDRNGFKREYESAGSVPHYFAYMDQATVATAWDFAANWRVRAEYHRVKGRGRLAPVFVADLQTNDSEYWDIWAVQIMYWF